MPTNVPAQFYYLVEVEDIAGQHANIRINCEYAPDVFTTPDAFFSLTLSNVASNAFSAGQQADIVTAIAALTNAKVVRAGFGVSMDFASEPASASGKNQFVQNKARLHFLDGNGYQEAISIPAPVDSLFLTGIGMQTVVNPALSLGGSGGIIGALQTAVLHVGPPKTPSGGSWGHQFQGGELITGKPPRRRRIQGQ